MSLSNLTHCVACGKRIQTGREQDTNHRCSAQFERRRAAANRREEEDTPQDDEPSFDEKLADGFAMLGKR